MSGGIYLRHIDHAAPQAWPAGPQVSAAGLHNVLVAVSYSNFQHATSSETHRNSHFTHLNTVCRILTRILSNQVTFSVQEDKETFSCCDTLKQFNLWHWENTPTSNSPLLLLFVQTGHKDPSGVVADPGWQDHQNKPQVAWLDQSKG